MVQGLLLVSLLYEFIKPEISGWGGMLRLWPLYLFWNDVYYAIELKEIQHKDTYSILRPV